MTTIWPVKITLLVSTAEPERHENDQVANQFTEATLRPSLDLWTDRG